MTTGQPDAAPAADMWLALLTLPGLGLAALGLWGPDWAAGAGIAGLLLVYGAGGIPAGRSALSELIRGRVDIDLLMIVAALAAAAVGAPFEGAVLLTLFALSGALEARAMGRARRAVQALMALRPEIALRREADGTVAEVAVSELRPGDIAVLRPGARVPVDGVLVLGEGALDESTITGESMPVPKTPGDALHEATVNLDAVLDMRVTRSLSESTVARMIALVTQAQAARAPSERFSTWFGQRYTVAVLVGAVLAFAVFMGLGRGWEDALYRAATLLVAASPCAIVISVPAAILSALAAAARGGVLFKGGAALETLAAVRSVAFDKTGTLTTGQAEVTGLATAGIDETAALALLAGIEAQSEHPIAAALRRAAAARGIAPAAVSAVVNHPSAGIEGTAPDGPVWAGNMRMLARHAATPDPALLDLARDHTTVWLGRGQRVLAVVTVADTARPTSRPALAALRAQGAQLAMMTGDRAEVAWRVGADLGLTRAEITADMTPADKVAHVATLPGPVAYVGDGVNDAGALARADVGICMGAAGSEVALQAADVALMSEDMTRLAEARRLAQRTAGIIRQNLAFALGAMAVLVIGGLFFDLPLPLAVIGHEGGTLLVVLNGLRLLADPIRRP